MKNKIPNKQIGWSEQANMIYEVLRELNALNNQLYLQTCCNTTTIVPPTTTTTSSTTTSTTTSTSTSTTTSTTTETPCCTIGTLEVNVTVPSATVNTILIEGNDNWYDVGSLGLPIDSTISPRSTQLIGNAGGTLTVTADNVTAEDLYLYIYLDCVQVGSCCVVPADTNDHLCTFVDFSITDFENQCMKVELTNISCT
jgi:hypothetical protein